MSYNIDITIGAFEIEFKVQIDAYIEDTGFSHEFGYKSCLEIMFDNVESLERVSESTFTKINKWSGCCEYDIKTKPMKFDKLRDINQDRILEAINAVLNETDINDFLNEDD